MTQPEKFKQYDASLTKHPNQSFIQLFFAKPNDILRFPLFFEDNPQRLEAIRARGGLSDFSPEALKQLQDIFHTLKSGDYSRYSPERVTYLDFLKNNTLHALKEYTAEYDRLENDLFRENNRIFAAEYFSRLSEITRQLGYVNGYLTMFSFSLAGCPFNGYSTLYNAVELKAWCFKIVRELRMKESIVKPIYGMTEEEMSLKARRH